MIARRLPRTELQSQAAQPQVTTRSTAAVLGSPDVRGLPRQLSRGRGNGSRLDFPANWLVRVPRRGGIGQATTRVPLAVLAGRHGCCAPMRPPRSRPWRAGCWPARHATPGTRTHGATAGKGHPAAELRVGAAAPAAGPLRLLPPDSHPAAVVARALRADAMHVIGTVAALAWPGRATGGSAPSSGPGCHRARLAAPRALTRGGHLPGRHAPARLHRRAR